jgi:surface polysaccharide O-acyltransferase-like enzyme
MESRKNEEPMMKINYLAVVVCAVVYWLLGGLWYALLFGKQWMALENMTIEQGRSMNSALPYIITFVLNLLIAFVLAQICSWRNANTAGRGAAIGVLLWVGIVAPITYTTYMYEMRPKELFAINEFYPLVGLCLMGLILGVWPKKIV